MGRLNGKVAIITGAAMGMGASEAKLFAQEGAKVIATDVQIEPLNNLVKEIKENGGDIIGLQHNVTSEDEWKAVIAEAVKAWAFHHLKQLPTWKWLNGIKLWILT